MAYCFERTEGMPVAGKWDLMTAADYLADVDLLQVSAFFEQHHGAEALIDAGDLAFVWLWERSSGARAGAGQAVFGQRSPTCAGDCDTSEPLSLT
jgi:hypothetical protein